MYPHNFEPKQKGINFNEIFVVMPFDGKHDDIFNSLIMPATERANGRLGFNGAQKLSAYRSKDDIRTTAGWINVLEHLLTAQIVLGVLTDNNPNVFYELGIAHATESIARQILIAPEEYEKIFDTKDLIYYEYKNNLSDSVEPLATRIVDALKSYNIEEEQIINRARMLIGPYEFEVVMLHGSKRFFALKTSESGRETYEKELQANQKEEYVAGAFERHAHAIANLCAHGILGLHTSTEINENGAVVNYAYHWTELGNCLLNFMKLITIEEVKARREVMPKWFY